jgi:hypothetical protein
MLIPAGSEALVNFMLIFTQFIPLFAFNLACNSGATKTQKHENSPTFGGKKTFVFTGQ